MFAIGTPGQQPRIVLVTNDIGAAEAQAEPGEVAVPISAPGEYQIADDGSQAELRTVPLAEQQAARMIELSDRFAAEIAGGCDSPKGRVDCDDQAASRIANTLMFYQMAALDPASTTRWTMFDKSKVDHDFTELTALGVAIGTGFAQRFGVKQTIEDAISAATTPAELDAIDITAGWPS